MNPTAKAFIVWKPAELGGRQHPAADGYTAPARFRQYGGEWGDPEWSLRLTASDAPDQYVVQYLVEAAPHENLTAGAMFEIFEGRNKVARGVVL